MSGPILVFLKSASIGPTTLYQLSLRGGLKRWDRNFHLVPELSGAIQHFHFDLNPELSGAIPAVLKTLG